MTDLLRKTSIYAVLTAIVYLVFFFFLDRPVDLWVNAHWSETWIHSWGGYISSVATGSYVMLALALCFLVVVVFDSVKKVRWTRLLLYGYAQFSSKIKTCKISLESGHSILKILLGCNPLESAIVSRIKPRFGDYISLRG